jgi:hypothetical protein
MEDKDGSKGGMFALFCFVVLIHNSLAPSSIRQELNDYSIKFYGITLLLGFIYILYRIFIKGEK